MTITQQMTDFVFDLEWSDVPTHVERAARRHLADTLACAVGAYREKPVRALRDYATETRSRGDSTLLGSSERTSASMGALVNGTMVRYLDANDISAFGGGHFSDGIPPLLAVAQNRGLSAGDLVLSIVALYEIQGALAKSFDFMRRGYHALTQIPWTVPIVAARLMGGDREAAVNAAGLSGATGMVLNTWLKPTDTIPSIKGVAVGLAGQRAVECADLAVRGVSASHDALEFALETLARVAGPPPDLGPFQDLGSTWTMHRHVIKPYPSQIYTQAAVEAALTLRRQRSGVDEIESVTVYGHRNVCSGVQGSAGAFRPKNREAADHSTPFVMAMALLTGRLTLEEFADEAWLSTEVITMMDRIQLVVDPERDTDFVDNGVFGVRLEARMSDGRSESVEIRQPTGHPDNPMTDQQLLDKMTWLTSGLVEDDVPRRIFDICMNMDTAADLTRLIDLCTVSDG